LVNLSLTAPRWLRPANRCRDVAGNRHERTHHQRDADNSGNCCSII